MDRVRLVWVSRPGRLDRSRRTAEAYSGLHTAYVFRSGAEAVEGIGAWNADVCIVDDHLPDGTGTQFIRSARTTGTSVRFLLLTRTFDGPGVYHAVLQGADGLLPDEHDGEELVAAVRSLAGGDPWLHRKALREWIAHARAVNIIPAFASLTTRENEVLHHLAEGLTYKAIGERLFIASNTVKNHVHHILAKLEVRNRIEAIRRYQDRRIE